MGLETKDYTKQDKKRVMISLRYIAIVDAYAFHICKSSFLSTWLNLLYVIVFYCVFQNAVPMKSILPFIDVVSVKEMTINGVQQVRTMDPESYIDIPPMEIKTYKIAFR